MSRLVRVALQVSKGLVVWGRLFWARVTASKKPCGGRLA